MFTASFKIPPIQFDTLRVSTRMQERLEVFARRCAAVSPKGVSEYSISLSGSWRGRVERKLSSEGVEGILENTASDSFRRMAGSPPGTWVRAEQGSPLFQWAIAKQLPARAVQRKIYAKGTERWRTGENLLGVDKDSGEIQSGGMLDVFQAELGKELVGLGIKLG